MEKPNSSVSKLKNNSSSQTTLLDTKGDVYKKRIFDSINDRFPPLAQFERAAYLLYIEQKIPPQQISLSLVHKLKTKFPFIRSFFDLIHYALFLE